MAKKYQIEIQDEDGTWDDVPPPFSTIEQAQDAVEFYRNATQKAGITLKQVRIREVGVDA